MAGIYRTKSGDTWDQIAKRIYGSERHVSFLMSNNQEFLEHFVFPEGIFLSILDLPEMNNRMFPDWRR